MKRNVICASSVAVVVFALGACGGSGKAKSVVTTANSRPATTMQRPDPDAPAPVVGTNGVTVTYIHKDSGVIAPRAMKNSESTMDSPHGGALFRVANDSGVAVYGASEGDVFPLLHTLPGWSLTKLSDDRTWTPGACAGVPNAVVGDRWMVTAEGAGGDDPDNPTNGTAYNQYFIRVYDRQTNAFRAVTPIAKDEPKRWQGPLWAVSPTEVAVVGSANVGWANGISTGRPEVIRTINLQTMAFRDEPYREPPAKSKPFTEKDSSDAAVLTSKATGRTLSLTHVVSIVGSPLAGETALVAYQNDDVMPSRVQGQVGVWNMATGDWNRAFDTQRAADPRLVPERFKDFGASLWFAGDS